MKITLTLSTEFFSILYLIIASVIFPQKEWISSTVCPNFLLLHILLIILSLSNLSNIPSPKKLKIYYLHPIRRKSLLASTLNKFIHGSDTSVPLIPPIAGILV